MTELILIHRPRNGNPLEGDILKKIDTAVPLWSTCLRQMAFLNGEQFFQIKDSVSESDEVYFSEEAFGFLLQVVCGLRSPLVGETEVQGQFKQFVQSLATQHVLFWNSFSSFFQQILSETKKIRSQHLLNLGSQSYGSLIRRRLKLSEGVSILGSGQLVQEILPWLKEVQRVHIHARSPEKASALKQGFPHVEVHAWPHQIHTRTLVIAAPIENQELVENLKNVSEGRRILNHSEITFAFDRVVDLRGEEKLSLSEIKSLGLSPEQYESLSQLMHEMDQDSLRISEKVKQAQGAIQHCVSVFRRKTLVRPGGWEDLCG